MYWLSASAEPVTQKTIPQKFAVRTDNAVATHYAVYTIKREPVWEREKEREEEKERNSQRVWEKQLVKCKRVYDIEKRGMVKECMCKREKGRNNERKCVVSKRTVYY